MIRAPRSQYRCEALFSGEAEIFFSFEPIPPLNPSGHSQASLDLPISISTDRAMEAWYDASIA
jgi:hypothetical protein